MESFLVRIYRRNEDNFQDITGTVTDIITSRIASFKTLAELGAFFLTVSRVGEIGESSQTQKTCRNSEVEDL